ncbi:MAG TPA: fluoride efflux transporter CrcB [Bauldia sp.]|jgi:CrcB protein
MIQIVLVFLGGGVGSVARHGVNIVAARILGTGFPWGTFIVNVVGSFAMGVIVAWLAFRAGGGWSQHTRLLLTTGFLGGFTTFSTFSLDTALLWERDAYAAAIGYVAISVLLGVLGLFAGLALIRSLT